MLVTFKLLRNFKPGVHFLNVKTECIFLLKLCYALVINSTKCYRLHVKNVRTTSCDLLLEALQVISSYSTVYVLLYVSHFYAQT